MSGAGAGREKIRWSRTVGAEREVAGMVTGGYRKMCEWYTEISTAPAPLSPLPLRSHALLLASISL